MDDVIRYRHSTHHFMTMGVRILVVTILLLLMLIPSAVPASAQDQTITGTGQVCVAGYCTTFTMTFNPNGGPITGSITPMNVTQTVEGVVVVSSINFNSLSGDFTGGDGGSVSGLVSGSGSGQANYQGMTIPISMTYSGTFSGNLNANGNGNGTITLNSTGSSVSGSTITTNSGTWTQTYPADQFQAAINPVVATEPPIVATEPPTKPEGEEPPVVPAENDTNIAPAVQAGQDNSETTATTSRSGSSTGNLLVGLAPAIIGAAAGGSIIITRKLNRRIGGYDLSDDGKYVKYKPEWDHAPEPFWMPVKDFEEAERISQKRMKEGRAYSHQVEGGYYTGEEKEVLDNQFYHSRKTAAESAEYRKQDEILNQQLLADRPRRLAEKEQEMYGDTEPQQEESLQLTDLKGQRKTRNKNLGLYEKEDENLPQEISLQDLIDPPENNTDGTQNQPPKGGSIEL